MDDFNLIAHVIGTAILVAMVLLVGCKLLDKYYPMFIKTNAVQNVIQGTNVKPNFKSNHSISKE